MQLEFTQEQEIRLERLAHQRGKPNAQELLRDLAFDVLEEEQRFRDFVNQGLHEANSGALIDEDAMDADLDRMLQA